MAVVSKPPSSHLSRSEHGPDPDLLASSLADWHQAMDSGHARTQPVPIPRPHGQRSRAFLAEEDPPNSKSVPDSSPKSSPTRISSFRQRFGPRKRKRSADGEALKLKLASSAPAAAGFPSDTTTATTTELPPDSVKDGFSRAHVQEARMNLNAICEAAEAVSARVAALVDACGQRRRRQLVSCPVSRYEYWKGGTRCPRCHIEEFRKPFDLKKWAAKKGVAKIEISAASDGKCDPAYERANDKEGDSSTGDEDSDPEPLLLARWRKKPSAVADSVSLSAKEEYEIIAQHLREFLQGEVMTRVEMTRAGEYERTPVKPRRRRRAKQAEHSPWQTGFCEGPILSAMDMCAPCPNMLRSCEDCPFPRCEATEYRPPRPTPPGIPFSCFAPRNPRMYKNGTNSTPCGISCRPCAETDVYHVTSAHLELCYTIERTIKRSSISLQRNMLKLSELCALGGTITESFDDIKKTVAYWRDLDEVLKDWGWVIARHQPKNWAEAREACRLEVEKARNPTDESVLDDCGAWLLLLGPKMQRMDAILAQDDEIQLHWEIHYRIQQIYRQQEVDVEKDWQDEKKRQGWKSIPTMKPRRMSVKDVSTWAWRIVTAFLKTRGERG
ncbi:hypothetical protein BZA05DRAFT_19719 [Tricharina praecox]|uniref:uncharacterized protein n=1 Tax=Tricharina praecox TaxID=43433 RepID=UPI00221EDC4C|nr:uncharacterized protein BZA05DRAFT_19719 [Tricharina praecox]KAI5859010.1 hypothetical protein BZA05DRAFT_19719 [Tricharina praecox]